MNRLSHSYIFLGTNKETTEKAIELAQTVNCENVHLAPCGLCSTCKKIQNGVYPDLIHVHPDGASIKIEQVRKLIMDLTEKPIEGVKKIYILHEAHTATLQAQNALLKTLEDPVSESVIILLSFSLKQHIPTVISRYQIRDFSQIETDPLIFVDLRREIADILLKSTVKANTAGFGEFVKRISDMDVVTEDVLEFIISLYRDVLLAKTNSKIAFINRDLKLEIDKYVSTLTMGSTLKALDIAREQLRIAKSRGNKNLIWYNLLVGLEEVI